MRKEGLKSVVIPEMLTKLRQNAGRLIRDVTHKGVPVILDSRAASRKYAGIIQQNMPPLKTIRDLAEIREFLLRPESEENMNPTNLPALL